MKKTIFVLSFLILFHQNSFSQNKWQIKAGPNYSYFVDMSNSSSNIGYILGIERKIDIYENLAVNIGLDYTTKGAVLNDRTIRPYKPSELVNVYSWDIHGNIDYLELPVLLSYAFPIYKEYKFGMFVGPSYAIPVRDLSEFKKVKFIEEYDPNNPGTTDYEYHFWQEPVFGNNTSSIIFNLGLYVSYSHYFVEFRYVRNNKKTYYFGKLSDVQYKIDTYQFLFGLSL